MKGLLRSNFYAAIDTARIVVVMLVVLEIVLVVSGSAALLSMLTLAVAPLLALMAVASQRRENQLKWSRYKLTFPIRRCYIIRSQYLSHLFWSLGGTAMAALFLALTLLVHGDQYFYYGFRDALTLVLGGAILAMLIGAIAYPLILLLGYTRTEVAMIAGTIGAIGVVTALSLLINIFTESDNITNNIYYVSLIFIMLIGMVLCCASYQLTARLFEKQEF